MSAPALQTAAASPRSLYAEQLRGLREADPAQQEVVEALQRLHEQLLTDPPGDGPRPLSERLLSWRRPPPSVAPRGLYIWGGVGRGKTWLMDLFFDSLPFAKKQRLHFHHFMRGIHQQLTQMKGQRDPLERIAAEFSQHTRVLCLDELYVSDIGDAMLLGRLLEGLFRHGVTLVTTSNVPPDHLYQDGLQRQAFLPTIALLKKQMQRIELGGGTDYRLKYLESAKIYHTPLDKKSARQMQATFDRLATSAAQSTTGITIEGREIPIVARAGGMVWFEFDTLCGGPRSAADYIEIATRFHTVILSGIPRMDDEQTDCVRRFMNLIDEFYDRNIKLIISAAAQPDELYQGKRLAFEYQRTASRLQEMQSKGYCSRQPGD